METWSSVGKCVLGVSADWMWMQWQAKKQADRVHTKIIANDELTARQEKMLEDAMRSKATVGDATNQLSLAQERAALVEDKAAQAQEEADEKKAKAEELLKTVDGLAGLAR